MSLISSKDFNFKDKVLDGYNVIKNDIVVQYNESGGYTLNLTGPELSFIKAAIRCQNQRLFNSRKQSSERQAIRQAENKVIRRKTCADLHYYELIIPPK